MNTSAGLVVIHGTKILLVRQNYDAKKLHLSIPKGLVNKGESSIDAAIRETFEETGVMISKELISDSPFIINVNNHKIKKRLIYYVLDISNSKLPSININDVSEITWAGFVEYEDARRSLQLFQKPILFHLNRKRLEPSYIWYLLENGYLRRERHPLYNIYLYNYTNKCKSEEFWNEITLWTRGIILDSEYNIIARPLKKFFEFTQLYEHIAPALKKKKYSIYEKKDGFLGILYWVNEMPFITTRDSFVSSPASIANIILYNKYIDSFKAFDKKTSYFFEIIYPNDYLVLNYGEIEDLYLLGAYDNENNLDLSLEDIEPLNFPIVDILSETLSFEDLLKMDNENEEGYVLRFDNGFRVKIKFPTYMKKYRQKNYE